MSKEAVVDALRTIAAIPLMLLVGAAWLVGIVIVLIVLAKAATVVVAWGLAW